MPQEQQFDPVAELKKQYPKIAGQSDEQIHSYLSVPKNFRAAFPKYKDLPDVVITENMARLGRAKVSAAPPDPVKQAQAQIKGIIPKEVEAEKKDPYSPERMARGDPGVRQELQFLKWRPRWDQPDQILKDPHWYGRSARYLGGELIGATKAGSGVLLGSYKLLNDVAAVLDPTEGMRHDRSLADIWGTLGKDLQGIGGAMKDVTIAAKDMLMHFPEFDSDPEKFGDTIANIAMIVDGGIKGAKSMAEMLKKDSATAAQVAHAANSGTPSKYFRKLATGEVYLHKGGLDIAKRTAEAQKAIHNAIEETAGGIATQIDTAIPSGVIDATAEAQLIRQEFADAVKFPERAHPTLVAAVKAADAAPGMWSWEKVRQLRSAVGRSIGRVEGPQKVVLTRVYKDLTRKLGGTATTYGLEDEWNYYNKLSSRYETHFADLADKIKESQSGKEVAGHLSRDKALTAEMVDNLAKYGLDSKRVMKFAKNSSRIMKEQTSWRGTLFSMVFRPPGAFAAVPTYVGARIAASAAGLPPGASWIGSMIPAAIAGYAFTHLVNVVRNLKLSPEVLDDILSSRELPGPRAVGRGTFPEAPPEVTPTPMPQAPPGAPASGAAPLPSPPGTAAPAALPAPAPEPTPATPTVVPEGVHGTGKLARQAKARERVAAKRAVEGSTAAGGGTLEISGGDVAGKAQEMQEAQRRAGAPDVDTSQFQVPEMEEALRSMMPRVWDRLQQARRAGKFAEQDYEHYLREMLLRAYEARSGPKPPTSPIIKGRPWSPSETPESQLPPHVEELGRQLGVTHFFLGAEGKTWEGLNLAGWWRDHLVDYYESQGVGEQGARYMAHSQINSIIEDIPGLTAEEKASAMNSVASGKGVVFLHPGAKGRGTAIHEIMHMLTGRELYEDLSGPLVKDSEIKQLISDMADPKTDIRQLLSRRREWLSRRQEYFTELMTQYFLKGLKESSKSHQLAEAILKSSENPVVRDLLGKALGVTIAFQLAKRMQGKAD